MINFLKSKQSAKECGRLSVAWLNKLINGLMGASAMSRRSYSQTGEDVIVDFIFSELGIVHPSYIDIGAFDPFLFSNTALLYRKGSRGINIEPNPNRFHKFRRYRRGDINLNVGIHSQIGIMDYYILDAPALNTFSRSEAEIFCREQGHRIMDVVPVEVTTLDNVLQHYNSGRFPDFMSLDAEGVDDIILGNNDFARLGPKVICLETLTYTRNCTGEKKRDIIQHLIEQGYFSIADTYINTIFVKDVFWNR